MRTLIVDDEPVNRNKLEKIMENFGECVSVDNGRAALDLFKNALEDKRLFDVVTLDVEMPEMDGFVVLRELKALEEENGITPEQQTKILMVTSHADPNYMIFCLQAGGHGFIVKPFDREIIVEKLVELGFDVS